SDLLTLLRGQSWSIIVDEDAHDPAVTTGVAPLDQDLDGDTRLRPFAGIVDKIADHFLQILALPSKACVFGCGEIDGYPAIAVNLFHRTHERREDGAHLGGRIE